MIDCLECNGEGSTDGPILCGGFGCKCDGLSGGCVEGIQCDLCDGSGWIDWETAYEWADDDRRQLVKQLARAREQLAQVREGKNFTESVPIETLSTQ